MLNWRSHRGLQCCAVAPKALIALVAIGFLLSSLPRHAGAQAPPHQIGLADYQLRLEQAIHELEPQAGQPGASSDRAQLRRVQANLDEIEAVVLPSGQVVQIRPLLDTGQASTTPKAALTLNNALARLHTAVEQIDASAADQTGARLRILQDILAQPQFNQTQSLWERIWRWIRDRLRALLPERAPATAAAPSLTLISRLVAWLAAGIGGLLLAWLLSYWFQGLLGNFVADAIAKRRQTNAAAPLTAQEAKRAAHAEARAGNFRQAVRHLYLSALLMLEENDIIDYDRSLTNREVLAQVPDDNPLRSHLRPVIETFDSVWYGIYEPDANTFSVYEQEIEALAEQAPQTLNDRTPTHQGST